MKRFTLYLFILFFVFFNISSSFAQQGITLDYKKTIDAINSLSKSSVFISTPKGVGTGTLFSVPFIDNSKRGATYLATALHVLSKTDSKGKVIGRYDTVNVYFNLLNGGKESRKYSLLELFDKLDIAILEPIEFFRSFREYNVSVPFIEMIASYKEIRKGQLAFIAEYPYGVGSQGNTLNPVTQSGIIAYVDTIYNLVLIDIPVNPGNSGSPVYVITDNGQPKLLGIVFQYQPSTQDYVYRIRQKTMAPANSSLGRVVILRSILSYLHKLSR